DFTEALRLNPSDKYAHYLRARAYAGGSARRDDFALADLMEAIRLDGRFLAAYYDRAYAYEALAIEVWLHDYRDPAGLETVPSPRILALYRRAYDDVSLVVRSDPTFADARCRLDVLAVKVARLEVLTGKVAGVERNVPQVALTT